MGREHIAEYRKREPRDRRATGKPQDASGFEPPLSFAALCGVARATAFAWDCRGLRALAHRGGRLRGPRPPGSTAEKAVDCRHDRADAGRRRLGAKRKEVLGRLLVR